MQSLYEFTLPLQKHLSVMMKQTDWFNPHTDNTQQTHQKHPNYPQTSNFRCCALWLVSNFRLRQPSHALHHNLSDVKSLFLDAKCALTETQQQSRKIETSSQITKSVCAIGDRSRDISHKSTPQWTQQQWLEERKNRVSHFNSYLVVRHIQRWIRSSNSRVYQRWSPSGLPVGYPAG